MTMEEPVEPGPEDCCGEGCASCVWDVYREKLQKWHAAQSCSSSESDGNQAMSKIHFAACIINTITEQTIDTSIYSFRMPNSEGRQLILKPGQHLEMKGLREDGEEVIRKYSPISWGNNIFDVIIKRYENGKMSAYLENIKEGDEIEWRGPYGNFQYNLKDQKLLLILCAGTGIAPMIPLIRSIVTDLNDDETVIQMLCGCHSLESRLLLPQLKELASFWNFSFVHYVTSDTGTPGWGETVVRGRITEENVIQAVGKIQPQLCRVLVCGPEAFCIDMKTIVTKIGAHCYCF